ncbi:MAG: GFA family protein [Alphaproteobacteria bacterium]
MATRKAAWCCGQLSAKVEGEPVRISMCHCLECQRRTGSIFGVQARWPRGQVRIEGHSTEYVRVGDSGGRISSHFCPACGTTLYYVIDTQPDLIAITVGSFADPAFPPPKFSVYESRKHAWFEFAPHHNPEHMD